MSFGSSTGKQREFFENIEDNNITNNRIVDLLKQISPGQKAIIISVDSGLFKVHLLDENVTTDAILGRSLSSFKVTGLPKQNDTVWVTHKRDGSYCTIEYIIDPEANPELNKRYTEDNKIKFRWDNTKDNSETFMDDVYKGFSGLIKTVFARKDVQPAVK
jgi:hypothetical protein